ncbi:MAG: hypothetical protein HRT72_03275, partial [Flavobacteriales bacterium]|nr:hypothetical protein [Flavobacteriales bacterium]
MSSRFNKILSVIVISLFTIATPVYSQCTGPDFDCDGYPDSVDDDDDNDGILDVDEGLPQTVAGDWGMVSSVPAHDGGGPVPRTGQVDNTGCGGTAPPIGYTITDDAAGGREDGVIIMSNGGWGDNCMGNNGYVEPAVVDDQNFHMMFDVPVNIRVASTPQAFTGVSPQVFGCIYDYWNEKDDDIFIETDGCDYQYTPGLGVGGVNDMPIGSTYGPGNSSTVTGTATAHIDYDGGVEQGSKQTWFIDFFGVTEVNIMMHPGSNSSQYAIAVDPASVCDALDTDSDGMPDYQDWDSDNDGCPDAVEGGFGFTYGDVYTDAVCDAGQTGPATGTTSYMLVGGVDANGVPNAVGSGGQTTGNSTNDLVLSPNCGPSCSLTPSHITCFGDGTGQLDMMINTSVAPYDIQWDGVVPDETSNDVSFTHVGVLAGTYEVTVTETGMGDVFTCLATVNGPDEIIVTVDNVTNEFSCGAPGSEDGAIAVTTTGGTLYPDVTSTQTT